MISSWFEMKPLIGLRGEIATGCKGSQQKKAKKAGGIKGGRMKSKGKGKPKEAEGVDLVVEKVEKVRLRAKPEKGTKMVLSEATKNEAMEAARYGMPIDRIAILCGFPSGNQTQWSRWINANPAFQIELEQARAQGELLLQRKIMSGEQNWQAAGWMLERTRGYVARASLEHTGKGGKELSISGSLLGAFGGGK